MTLYIYKRGTSRGRDTYGYTLVTLTNADTGKRYRTAGGGYDMLGTCAGEILNTEHGQALRALAKRAESYHIENKGFFSRRAKGRNFPDNTKHLYGITAYYDHHNKKVLQVVCDGACGLECMRGIAKAIGLDLRLVQEKTRRDWKLIAIEIKPLEKA